MINRPDVGAGKCGRKQPSGYAAATAVRNSPSRKSRVDSIEAQARARLARQNSTSRPLRGWFIMMLAK
jgi:hypothetical protein